MRIIGLDYGSKTVGVAVSDPLMITAQGVEIIRRESENKLRKTYAESYKQLIPYYVKHYRAKYETLYGEEITELLTKNLSKKMSSLPRATIIARNAAISVGMLNKNKKGAPE